VRILDGSVVPPNMVIPSFSVVAGRPARVVGEIAEGGFLGGGLCLEAGGEDTGGERESVFEYCVLEGLEHGERRGGKEI